MSILRLNLSFSAKFICPVFHKIQLKHLFIFHFFRRIQFKHLFIFHFSSRFNSKVDSLFCFPTKFNSKIYSKYWNWLYSIQWNIHSTRKPGLSQPLPLWREEEEEESWLLGSACQKFHLPQWAVPGHPLWKGVRLHVHVKLVPFCLDYLLNFRLIARNHVIHAVCTDYFMPILFNHW